MRSVTYVSSSPVITYLRWDRENNSACCWVRVYEGGDAPLVYGGEDGEEHVYAARPSIRLLRSALDMGDRCFLVEEWGCYF